MMQTNPDKFQAIAIDKNTNKKCESVKDGDWSSEVKLPRGTIDFHLKFDKHIAIM